MAIETRTYENQHARVTLYAGGPLTVHARDWAGTGRHMLVTARWFDDYTARDRNGTPIGPSHLHPSFSVCEWGPGLGGFVEHCVERGVGSITAIDPIDYEAMRDVLARARDDPVVAQRAQLLDTLIGRCELMLSGKVTHVPLRVSETIAKHPGIVGSFDLLVDQNGPGTYADREDPSANEAWKLDMIAQRMLKPNGRYFRI